MKPRHAGSNKGRVLLEVREAALAINGGTLPMAHASGILPFSPDAATTGFYGTNHGGGDNWVHTANGLVGRRLTGAVAASGKAASYFPFPLRNRWTVAPIIPEAMRKYYRHTWEVTAWRSGATALSAFELAVFETVGAPPPNDAALIRCKFGVRSLVGESALWQTTQRLVSGAATTRVATTLSPLVPVRFAFIFDSGPIPRFRITGNNVSLLDTVAMPTAVAENTGNATAFFPAFGQEGAVGDLMYAMDSLFRLEALN